MMQGLMCLVLLGVCGYRGVDAQTSTQDCDIPPQSASTVSSGQPAIDFAFGSFRDSFGAFLTIPIIDNIYKVDNCMPVVYVLTDVLPPLPIPFDFVGETVKCYEVDTRVRLTSNQVASGTILKFDTDSLPRPDDVPESWYTGSNLVLELDFSSFPGRDFRNMQCTYTVTAFALALNITFDLEAKTSGCPITHWGTNCQSDCPCQSIGRCHTFTGECICPEGVSDPLCETVPEILVSATDAPLQPESPLISEQTTSQTEGGTGSTSARVESTTTSPASPVERSPADCDISIPSNDAAVGVAPITINISDIQQNVGLFNDARFSDVLYEVNTDCLLNLYTRSPVVPRLAIEIDVFNSSINCYGLTDGNIDESTVLARGVVLKYLVQREPRPEVLPEFWYEEERIVTRVTYETFPVSSEQNMRCIYTFTIPGLVLDIYVDIKTSPVGCPVTHWGSQCQSDCPCQNGGRCHTFTGDCSCPIGYSGAMCENGPSTAPPIVGGELEVPGNRDSISECYPLMQGLNEEPLTVEDFQFSAGPFTDSFRLIRGVTVTDQRHAINNCSLNLYTRTSDLPSLALSFNLLAVMATCLELDDNSEAGTTVVAFATVLKYGPSASTVSSSVPSEWYEGNGGILKITFRSIPKSSSQQMRCVFREPSLNLDISIDITTTVSGIQVPFGSNLRTSSPSQSTQPPSPSAQPEAPVTQPLSRSKQPDAPGTQPPAAVTQTPAPVTQTQIPRRTGTNPPAAGEEFGLSNGGNTIDQCYPLLRGSTEEPLTEEDFQFTAGPFSDGLGLIRGVTVTDQRHAINNCSLNLYTRTSDLPSLALRFNLLGMIAPCFVLSDNSEVLTTSVAFATVLKYGPRASPVSSSIPSEWYDSNGVILKISFRLIPKSPSQQMRCSYTVPFLDISVWIDIATTVSVSFGNKVRTSLRPSTQPPSSSTQSSRTETNSPGAGGELGRLDGGNTISQCYPLLNGPAENRLTIGDFQIGLGRLRDKLNLIQDVFVIDQRQAIKNCSLNLYVTTSNIPSLALRFNLLRVTMPCFRLDEGSEMTTIRVADGTVLKYGSRYSTVSDSVPIEWYEGTGLILSIVYRTLPKSSSQQMRCVYVEPSLNLPIFIDVSTTVLGSIEPPRRDLSSTPPPTTPTAPPPTTPPTAPPTTTTTPPSTITTTPSTPPPTTPPTTPSTPPPTTPPTTPSTPPPTTPPTTPPPTTPPTTTPPTTTPPPPFGSVQRMAEYRCLIPPSGTLSPRENQPAINFTFSSMKDTSGVLTNVQLIDHVFDVFNCTVQLFVQSSPLPSSSIDLLGKSLTCFHLHGESVTSKEVATAKVYRFGGSSILPKPAMVPESWYNGDGLVLGILYNYFPGLNTKHMRCIYQPSVASEISADVNTTSIGCPASHWGANCDKLCPCSDGGRCYTFVGGCHCFNNRYGRYCEHERRL